MIYQNCSSKLDKLNTALTKPLQTIKQIGIIFFSLLTLVFQAYSQDATFSQFSNQSLSRNPALVAGRSHISTLLHFRTQWNTYDSYEINVSYPFLGDGSKETGAGGIGLYARNSTALDGAFSKLDLHLAGAYNIQLSGDGSNNIIFGLDAGLIQNTLNINNFTTGAQYTSGIGFSESLDNMLASGTDQTSTLDLAFGINFNHNQNFDTRKDKLKFTAGIGVFHLNQPALSFNDGDSKLSMRISPYLDSYFRISTMNFIRFNTVFNSQGAFSQLQTGLFLYHIFRDKEESILNTSITIGSYYRIDDAIIPYVEIEFKSFGLGMSYDITLSSLSSNSNYGGAIEIMGYLLIKQEPKTKTKQNLGGARFKDDY